MSNEEKTMLIQDAMRKLTEARVAVETALELLAKTVPEPKFTNPPATVTRTITLGLPDQSVCSVPLPIRDYPVLPEEYDKMLTLSRDKDDLVLKPKGWLGTEGFAEIMRYLKGLGGRYVSAGKASHFRVEGWFKEQ